MTVLRTGCEHTIGMATPLEQKNNPSSQKLCTECKCAISRYNEDTAYRPPTHEHAQFALHSSSQYVQLQSIRHPGVRSPVRGIPVGPSSTPGSAPLWSQTLVTAGYRIIYCGSIHSGWFSSSGGIHSGWLVPLESMATSTNICPSTDREYG